jgi:hypothetical protein
MAINDLKAKTIVPILKANIDCETRVMIDEADHYRFLSREFQHDLVSHGKGEYGRGEIHINTIEGFFSIFKRGHERRLSALQREASAPLLAEFDFRYNTRVALEVDDREFADKTVKGVDGKRLT